MCYVDDAFLGRTPVRQLDTVIDLAVPWYLNFYASWFTGRQAGEVDFLWIDYESLNRDTAGQLRQIVEYLGLSRSDEAIQEAMHKAAGAPTRLNVGRAGRGARCSLGSRRTALPVCGPTIRKSIFLPSGSIDASGICGGFYIGGAGYVGKRRSIRHGLEVNKYHPLGRNALLGQRRAHPVTMAAPHGHARAISPRGPLAAAGSRRQPPCIGCKTGLFQCFRLAANSTMDYATAAVTRLN